MSDMDPGDWTTDDTLSEEQIRERMAAEGWKSVAPLDVPASGVIESSSVSADTDYVWSHSDQVDDEHVRTSAA